MRLADEHAVMVELLRDLLAPHVLEAGPNHDRVVALLAEVDKP